MTTRSLKNLFPGAARAQCNGCGVCMLSCPVWIQHRTPALTSCGRSRAVQDGAQAAELSISARTCILCGSCEALCPRDIRTLQATLRLRSGKGHSATKAGTKTRRGKQAHAGLLLAGSLRNDKELLDLVREVIGPAAVTVADDDGQDIAASMETGADLQDNRVANFVSNLAGASEITIADGILFALLKPLLPKRTRLRSLGEALLVNPDVRAGLRPTDLYIIEARAYNLRWSEMVKVYDKLRSETGCGMNLDLQRVATPTGCLGMRYRGALPSFVTPAAQVAWILEGRKAERIVVEHPDDRVAFEKHSSLPVVHLAEVVQS